ncbi:MAG: ATP-dependent DNA helicase [Alphaproteobacteria bacterium]|nr:ATP-dependent DNA helicase [Alphaproteobacteria bacterium]
MTTELDTDFALRRCALVARGGRAAWRDTLGRTRLLDVRDASDLLAREAPLVVHLRATARRLTVEPFPAFDLLELWAFVRPAAFCLPTPAGLAQALGLPRPHGLEAEAELLAEAATRLLAELALPAQRAEPSLAPLARLMSRGGWRWGPPVLAALGADPAPQPDDAQALAVWKRLGEWAEFAPEPPAGDIPVEPVEARARLVKLLGAGAEARPQQADYASAASFAFAPREHEGEPRVVLAEAGTGVGKTLGYLAPATVWAEKNGAPVWVSTFTRNLQHQIDRELDRLYADADTKRRKVVVRKGRENYLCLLNLEEAAQGVGGRPHDAVALGLVARWAAATRDGDMVGGDFPSWLIDLVGHARTRGLADQRGECIHAACTHYRRCVIEKTIRRSRRADIVIANHALVLVQAATGGIEERLLPSRYVFDEGHHLFDAADSAFAANLSGDETVELRRWIVGAESGARRSRARGLKKRIGDLVADDPEASELVEDTVHAAAALTASGWEKRLRPANAVGPAERFLAFVRQQVYARAKDVDDGFSLEAGVRPPVEGLIEAASELDAALARLATPMQGLVRALHAKLERDARDLDPASRGRLEAAIRGLERRIGGQVLAWRAMLQSLSQETPAQFVDWFEVERDDGRDMDVGFQRRWLDPTEPLAGAVLRPAQGALVTSATLTDGSEDNEAAWAVAIGRSGARHLPDAMRASVPSPFDYPRQTRVLVITDLGRDDPPRVASAVRELFLAAGGGGLGLFTAISRLRRVHGLIARDLEAAGLPLYAQHVDALDTGTLVDIFRAEEDACLLGTDAVRDGVDVPGRSLRLIVFDRVPWPRPTILHKARKAASGGSAYDDTLTRLKIKQAFGRLVRRADDHGVFVMLDSRLPSRLKGAFPPGVEVQRVGLAEAIATVRAFLAPPAAAAP